MLLLEVLENDGLDIGLLEILDISGTTGEVIKDIADLKIV